MIPPITLLLVGAAMALAGRPSARRQAASAAADTGQWTQRRPGPRTEPPPGRLIRPVLAAVLAGCAVAVLVGGAVGVAGGVLIGAVARHGVARLEPASARRLRERRTAQLPTVLDLVAAGLRAGRPLVSALEVVVEALPGPLADDLTLVAALSRLGASTAAAWGDHLADPVLAPVARSVIRSAESGSRLAVAFETLASELRSAAADTAEARARRVGVFAMAPLGLCFLPAFLCVGIVPTVLALMTEMLHP